MSKVRIGPTDRNGSERDCKPDVDGGETVGNRDLRPRCQVQCSEDQQQKVDCGQ